MIYKLIYIAGIIYGFYFYRRNEPWAIKFIILCGLFLIMSTWESVSANYLDLSVEVRKIETILIGSVRLVVIIVFVTELAKDIVPYLRNRFRKKKDD